MNPFPTKKCVSLNILSLYTLQINKQNKAYYYQLFIWTKFSGYDFKTMFVNKTKPDAYLIAFELCLWAGFSTANILQQTVFDMRGIS